MSRELTGPAPLSQDSHDPPPSPPRPPTPSMHLPSTLDEEVAWKETRRRKTIEIGIQLAERQMEAADAGEDIPYPNPKELPIEWFNPAPRDSPIIDTPKERFCMLDPDDADAVYGRIQWAKEGNPPLSLEGRQQHANYLALRFRKFTATQDQQSDLEQLQLEEPRSRQASAKPTAQGINGQNFE